MNDFREERSLGAFSCNLRELSIIKSEIKKSKVSEITHKTSVKRL